MEKGFVARINRIHCLILSYGENKQVTILEAYTHFAPDMSVRGHRGTRWTPVHNA